MASSVIGVTTSGIAGDVLSNYRALGSLGDLVFRVSPLHVLTFETLNRTSSVVFADHEVAGRKPISEKTGDALDEIDLHIVLCADLGVKPREESEKLNLVMRGGAPQRLIIGQDLLGDFTIRTIADEWTYVSGTGAVIMMALDIHLVEYVPVLPTQAQQVQRRDEIKRPETGKGGPQRLPGATEPAKKRNLEPKIDPVTRMEINP